MTPGLKPSQFGGLCGMAEAMPFHYAAGLGCLWGQPNNDAVKSFVVAKPK